MSIVQLSKPFDPDYARKLVLDDAARWREIRSLEQAIGADEKTIELAPSKAVYGVTVIVPTYNGADRIGATLESLALQDLEPTRYEVIVVVNGPDEGTLEAVQTMRFRYPNMNLRSFYRPKPSAGSARNLALDLAQHSFVTFVDDDDSVERHFLSDALTVADEKSVVLSPIVNIRADGSEEIDNILNQRISGMRDSTKKLSEASWSLGFNACKLVPTSYARRGRYREDLSSGEDLVYFAELLKFPELQLKVAPSFENNAYRRFIREDSVSRRTMTFDFAVQQRLACIYALEQISVPENTPEFLALDQLKRAQAGFIKRYLEEDPSKETAVYDAIEEARVVAFPWDVLNRDRARDLAIVYCFAPFSDTSAAVASKAIAERCRIVDVITNDMSSVRRLDPAVSALADRWIASRTVIDARPSFAGWEPLSEFAQKALAVAEKKHALGYGYETMYSRALWVGSHVAAALFKLKHWNVRWTAEFSDPLRRGADGAARQGTLTENDTARRLKDGIYARGFGNIEIDTLFDLVEVATLVLADEIIFTNDNQYEYMMSLTDDNNLRKLVATKATVREHPTPPARAYDLVPTTYAVPTDVVNIAYFGSFYPNRGIGEVLVALANSRQEIRQKIRLHVFCNKPAEVAEQVLTMGLGPNVYTNPYLSYMEFLNATTKFDILLVNDVQRDERLPINPFLPSKLSDYRGSGRAIWAIVDEDSPLSRIDCSYRTRAGNSSDVVQTLQSIVQSYKG